LNYTRLVISRARELNSPVRWPDPGQQKHRSTASQG